LITTHSPFLVASPILERYMHHFWETSPFLLPWLIFLNLSVNLLPSFLPCLMVLITSFNEATVLFYLFMNCHSLEDRIKFLNLHPFRCVLFIFCGNIPRSTWLSRIFMLCTLQYDLNPVPFFCHCKLSLIGLFYQPLCSRLF